MSVPKIGTAHSAITLTASDQNSSVISVSDYNCLTIEVAYTTGADETNNVAAITVLGNTDAGTTYSDYCTVTDSSGTNTVNVTTVYNVTGASAATTYNKVFSILNLGLKEIKIAIKETGVASNYGTATVKYRLMVM